MTIKYGDGDGLPGKDRNGFRQHPDRVALNNEVHSRPFIGINSPSRCTHIAMLHGPETAEVEWSHITRLRRHFTVPDFDKSGNHLIVDFDGLRLRWERHTEFSSYTFIREGGGKAPFRDTALAVLPEKWLHDLPGLMLVGVHLFVTNCSRDNSYNSDEILDVFGAYNIVGARVSSDCATAWTDFRLHGDGFSRILINNITMKERQTGRLLQRLWEIETYRMMSLLSMSLISQVSGKTRAIETKLAENVSKMTNVHDAEQEQRLLETLTQLAAQTEQLSAETSFRFNASRAYYALVLKRVEEIKEGAIEGIQRISSFIDRRLGPAMRTVESMDARVAILSQRVSRASGLLQARINTTLQAQNKELLESMDRRARLQLRLQQTIEGLSVVAISYYALGIIDIIATGGAKLWPVLEPTLIDAASAPFVIGLVYLGIRRIHKVITKSAVKFPSSGGRQALPPNE